MILSDNPNSPMAAIKRWCFMASTTVGGVIGSNRTKAGPADGTNCLGSTCAAWRFISNNPDEHRGYCGVAGNALYEVIDETKADSLPIPGTAGGNPGAIPVSLKPRK